MPAEKAISEATGDSDSGNGSSGCKVTDCAAEEALRRVRPRFVSARYGQPAYGQLHTDTAEEIRRGADDRSEIGASTISSSRSARRISAPVSPSHARRLHRCPVFQS